MILKRYRLTPVAILKKQASCSGMLERHDARAIRVGVGPHAA
jgi:hypothetical protein